jgi:hypothetical protein
LDDRPDVVGPVPNEVAHCKNDAAEGIRVFDYSRWLNEQREADEGARAQAYDDPLWVAMSAYGDPVKIRATMEGAPQETDIAPGLRWYSWKLVGVKGEYGVLVRKPFMLSYYAKDSKKVIWIVARAEYSSCGWGTKIW